MEDETRGVVERIEITARLSRQSLEALYLELRHVAKRYGAEIKEFRVESVTGETASTSEKEKAER